ncbi:class I SAM-dependent methyltransferase [Aeromonas veronii]
MMKKKEQDKVIERYRTRFAEHGYSPKTLGWDKGKQDVRYETLFKGFELKGKRVLDIGCGFGDANIYLKSLGVDYYYMGIDLVDVLVAKGKEMYAQDVHINFVLGDFLTYQFDEEFDIIVASGVFNFKMEGDDTNQQFIRDVIGKAFSICREGISFDFLSNKVDYELAHTFHSDPCDILNLFYSYTKCVVLNNDVMPFEFTVKGYKDQSFSAIDTLFLRYKSCKK